MKSSQFQLWYKQGTNFTIYFYFFYFFLLILVFFFENKNAKSWQESNSECQNMDMELAVLNSYEDHQDAIEFIVNSGLYGYV